MLRHRILSATLLLTVLFGLVFIDFNFSPDGMEGIWLVPLLLFFTFGTALELARLLADSGLGVNRKIVVLGACGIALSPCATYIWGSVNGPDSPFFYWVSEMGWVTLGVSTVISVILVSGLIRYDGISSGLAKTLQTETFIAVYVGIPFGILVTLRCMGDRHWGLVALLTLVGVTKSADMGAYFTGRLCGRNRLAPRISPGKTVEGSLGGIVTSIAVAYGCLFWVFPKVCETEPSAPWWGPLLLGTVCAVSGMMGDLIESLTKRDAGVKDSGSLLPGMGGVWDVTDSLLGSAFPGFLCFAIGVAGK